nr:S-locus glycoprotein domain-containing protein [Tanacetum cinerariifolium]
MVELEEESVIFPLVLYDGEREIDVGHVKIRASLDFKQFQMMLKETIGISYNNLTTYFVDSNKTKVPSERRKTLVTGKVNFEVLMREKDCYFLVVLKRSRRDRRRKPNKTSGFEYVYNPVNEYLMYLNNHMMKESYVNRFMNWNNCGFYPQLNVNFSSFVEGGRGRASCEECTKAEKLGMKAAFHFCVYDDVVSVHRPLRPPPPNLPTTTKEKTRMSSSARAKVLVLPIVLNIFVLVGLLTCLLYIYVHKKRYLKRALNISILVSRGPSSFNFRDLQNRTTYFSELLGTGDGTLITGCYHTKGICNQNKYYRFDASYELGSLVRVLRIRFTKRKFQPFGRIMDAFIANKRSKIGKRFDFVRFLGIRDEEAFVRSLSKEVPVHLSNNGHSSKQSYASVANGVVAPNKVSSIGTLNKNRSILLNEHDLIKVENTSTVVLVKVKEVDKISNMY